jgi:hypothetical protein
MKYTPYLSVAVTNVAICALIAFAICCTGSVWSLLGMLLFHTYVNPENERIKLERARLEYEKDRKEGR